MSQYLSDTWLGGSGSITNPANYVGSGVFPVIFYPEGEGAYSYVLSTFYGGNFYEFQQSPTGAIGVGSQLEFSGGAVFAGASPSWTGPYFLEDGVSPVAPPPAPSGVIVSQTNLPPDYTVAGDASVASIAAVYDDPDSTITFTGEIDTGILSVDGVTAEFDGGGVGLDPSNGVDVDNDGVLQSWATVDHGGRLVLSSGAYGDFEGAVDDYGDADGLQVGDGSVLVSGAGSSSTRKASTSARSRSTLLRSPETVTSA